jgi:hypothetical protein
MELSHYEAVPPNVQAQLVTEHKASRKQAEDD